MISRLDHRVLGLLAAMLCSILHAKPPAFDGITFATAKVFGVGAGDETTGNGEFDKFGVGRRDPSDVIRLYGQYYVFYTKMARYPKGKLGPVAPTYPAGYAYGEIWYATSKDGENWTERGRALDRGAPGAWDSFAVFTPNIIKGLDDELYLYYTAVDEDGGGYNGNDTFNNDSDKDITQIGVARLTLDDKGLVTGWTRLNNSQPILSPTFEHDYQGGPSLFDSFRVDDAAMLIRDFDGDGELEYGLYYKGRAQGKTPRQTEMGLAVSDRPDGGFKRVRKDGQSIQDEGHEVVIWAQGEGVASLAMGAGRGIWYAEDAINFREVTDEFSGSPRIAPGAYRPELVDHGYRGGVQWGLRHTQGTPQLGAWKETSGALLASTLAGDVNGDAKIDNKDLELLMANWNETVAAGSRYDGDLTGDGLVGQADFEIIHDNWTEGEPPQSMGSAR